MEYGKKPMKCNYHPELNAVAEMPINKSDRFESNILLCNSCFVEKAVKGFYVKGLSETDARAEQRFEDVIRRRHERFRGKVYQRLRAA